MERHGVKRVEAKELPITYPDGSSSGMTIELRDMQSPEVKSVLKKWDRIASKSRKGLTFEQKEEASIELLCAATKGWDGFTDNGEEIECTDAEKRLFYAEPEFRFAREQVDDFLGEVGNFLQIGTNN